MIKNVILFLLGLSVFSCKDAPEKTKENNVAVENSAVQEIKDDSFPEAFTKVLDAHGTLAKWKEKATLSYEMPKPDQNELHTIDLKSRRDRIDMGAISMGFDGSKIWLKDENAAYKGNAAVYHNLMFYFYAMPFVFADPGINYGKTEPLEYEGKSYPGIHISFNDGVGASSKDDYFLHYDPETYQMAWLGYTFTYGSDEKSDNVKWIRYNDWQNIDGVLLPKSITWHNYEGRSIKEGRDPVQFENVTLETQQKPDAFYQKPESAKEVLNP